MKVSGGGWTRPTLTHGSPAISHPSQTCTRWETGPCIVQGVGAENHVTSCDLRILVDQPAETIAADDLDIGLDRVG
ncbi:hypothetical protein GCM10010404_58640 [Nonomuraea africana]